MTLLLLVDLLAIPELVRFSKVSTLERPSIALITPESKTLSCGFQNFRISDSFELASEVFWGLTIGLDSFELGSEALLELVYFLGLESTFFKAFTIPVNLSSRRALFCLVGFGSEGF